MRLSEKVRSKGLDHRPHHKSRTSPPRQVPAPSSARSNNQGGGRGAKRAGGSGGDGRMEAARSSFGPHFGPGQCGGPGRTPAPEKSEDQNHPAHSPRRRDPDPQCALGGGPRLSPQDSPPTLPVKSRARGRRPRGLGAADHGGESPDPYGAAGRPGVEPVLA